MITAQNNMFSSGGKYRSLLFAAAILCGAFAAQSAGSLPAGYTEIEYIQGNGTNARIVTDYIPNPQTDKVEAVVECPVGSFGANHQQIWCARGNGGTDRTWAARIEPGRCLR